MWTTHSRLRTADPGGGLGTSVDDSRQTEDGGPRGEFGTSVDDSRQTEDGGPRGRVRDQCGRLTAD